MDVLKSSFIQTINSLPDSPYLKSALIMMMALFLSWLASIVINKVFLRGARRTRFQFDDFLFASVNQPVVMSILLLGVQLAAEQLQLQTPYLSVISGIIATVAVFIWTRFALAILRKLLRILSADKSKVHIVQSSTLPLFDNLVIIVLTALAIYFIFLAWDIDVSAWVASAGILGLGLSLAAKDTLANLFAGVFIVADSPYKVGDYIVLDSGERGCVTHIGIRSTRILTRDDVEITVPNAIMGNTKIINESAGPYTKYRIRLKVAVAYGSDIDQVREVLLSVANECEEVEKTPDPRVRFRNFADSGLDFELLCWVAEPVLRGRVLDKLHEMVYKRFLTENIEIPYPAQDIHIRSLPS